MAIIDAPCTKVRKLNYVKYVSEEKGFACVYNVFNPGKRTVTAVLTAIRPIEELAMLKRQAECFNANFSECNSEDWVFADERTMRYISEWQK